MQAPKAPKLPGRSKRSRRPKNSVTTSSGKTLTVNRSLNDRRQAGRVARQAAKAEYLSTLPKNRLKRILVRLEPKRVARYWFSREGGIMALRVIGVSFVLGFILIIGMFAYFRKDLPKIKDIDGSSQGGSVSYYDRTGQTLLFQDYDEFKRTPVQTSEMSIYIRQATVAIEDKDFYKEGAFNIRGIIRAAAHDATGGSTQGGSTITQQLVKLDQNWTNDRTITRKVKELILAEEIEREYTKADILTGYLNIAPYSGTDTGIEAAAQDYFHISAKNLTLEQSTLLAAIPQSPGQYAPYDSPKYNPGATESTFNEPGVIQRQHYILAKMVEQHYITQAQADAAKKVDVLAQVQPLQSHDANKKAPFFVDAAKAQLIQKYGTSVVDHGGWKVITTLNLDLQAKAEQLVASNATRAAAIGADEEAMVGEDVQTGQIVMLVGGTDFSKNQNNYAARVKIPPGSSFKPYDYVTLINNNNNVGASSVEYDTQGALPGYPCSDKTPPETTNPSDPDGSAKCLWDFDRHYTGPLTLRYALGGSRNVPAVKAMTSAVPNDTSKGKINSINSVINTASAMMDNTYAQDHNKKTYNCYADAALTIPNQCGSAAAIGDGAYLTLDNHVNGLATMARLGNAIPRTYIMSITDTGKKPFYQWTQPQAKQVVKADAAYILNDMASDPRASYLSGNCNDTSCTPTSFTGTKFHRYQGWHFAIKTGTTDLNYDGLMTSWSTKYAVVSWIGSSTRQVQLKTTAMENYTEPLTGAWMEYAHAGVKPVNWTQPASVKVAAAYTLTHASYRTQQVPGPTTDLYPGWYAGGSGTNNKNTSQTLDKVSGKVATSCTPASAKQVQANGNVAFWNVDIYNGGRTSINGGASTSPGSNSAAPTDDIHNCNDSPPTITLTAPSDCTSSCTITATVSQGTHPFTDDQYAQFPGTITFNLGSNQIYTANVSDSPSTISFPYKPSSSGDDTLTATVTDSVLYSASDSAHITYAPAAAAQAITVISPTPNQTFGSNSVLVTWNATVQSATFTVQVKKNTGSESYGCNSSNTSCSISLSGPGQYSLYVKDAEGNQSGVVNFTRS